METFLNGQDEVIGGFNEKYWLGDDIQNLAKVLQKSMLIVVALLG